jgi:hypothetical protein
MLELYKKYVDPSFEWKNFTQEEQAKILLSERSNNELTTDELHKMFPNIKNIKESVEELFKEWDKSPLKGEEASS